MPPLILSIKNYYLLLEEQFLVEELDEPEQALEELLAELFDDISDAASTFLFFFEALFALAFFLPNIVFTSHFSRSTLVAIW